MLNIILKNINNKKYKINKMETEERFKEIVEVLSKIKSEDGSKDLLSHLEAMNQIKIELNDDRRYYDLFEDKSINDLLLINDPLRNSPFSSKCLNPLLSNPLANASISNSG